MWSGGCWTARKPLVGRGLSRSGPSEYHGRFLDRYGPGAVVPVDQLVDPIAGLGYPCRYQDMGRAARPEPLSGRDERLLALAQDAALNGARELVINDDALDALATDGTSEAHPPPHV